ncbi:hypothetical protein J2T13_000798 [Paenibacillus sp. DS2015]|uniref:hypothetical protein n=1 Tax=Paenibacillus sp. DS2015 TaxID=3373917 RepID=UPI003D199F91
MEHGVYISAQARKVHAGKYTVTMASVRGQAYQSILLLEKSSCIALRGLSASIPFRFREKEEQQEWYREG